MAGNVESTPPLDRCPVGEDCVAEYCSCWKQVEGITSTRIGNIVLNPGEIWIKSAGCAGPGEDATLPRQDSTDAPERTS